jgi:tryptophan 2,3-dioxygenase
MTRDPPPAAAMTYDRYLALDQLLSAQHPVSDEHDELLFIVIHQTKELWLKQMIAEVRFARDAIVDRRLHEAYKILARVSRIQAVMTLSWDVLATITPTDYTRFRGVLGTSSGFQSDGFRAFEVLLGLKVTGAPGPLTRAALAEPNLWDTACAALAGAGLAGPREAAWAEVYREPERWWDLYQLAEKLVDLDDALAGWRHKHVLTVSRIIGGKRGTGGTAGVPYLESTITKRAFPELWSLRTLL